MAERTPTITGRDAWDRHADLVHRMEVFITACPECQCGQCWNCDGTTFDAKHERDVPCPCASIGHQSNG